MAASSIFPIFFAPADPLKKPTQPMLALFGSTIGAAEAKPKEALAWEKTKGIE